MGHPPAITEFAPPTAALRDSDLLVRRVAAEAMASLGSKAQGVVPELVIALKDSDPKVRNYVLESLGFMGANAALAVPVLVEMMKDPEASDYQLQLLMALEGIGKPAAPALPSLLSVFRDKDAVSWIRQSALSAMLRIDEPAKETQTALNEARTDRDDSIRAMATGRRTGNQRGGK